MSLSLCIARDTTVSEQCFVLDSIDIVLSTVYIKETFGVYFLGTLETIVFCYQNCSKKAWKSVRKNDTSVNKKFFQLNQGWKRTSRKRFLRPRPFLRSRPKAETEKWRPRPRNVSEMSFFNRGLIENIFYSHESFFITLFQAFLEQFW